MTPERYQNLSGNSGVTMYAIGDDFIAVQFTEATVYVYDAVRPGAQHVTAMTALALAGRGLGTYISKNVRKEFSRKQVSW